MKDKIIRRKFTFILIIILLSISFFFLGIKKGKEESKPTITSSLLTNRLENVKELVSTNYYYKNMGSFQNQNKFYGWDIPFTEKKFIVSYEGLIKIGVDLNNAKVNVKDKEINITIPKSKIISHEIDENSLKVFDEKTSIFNPIKVEDYSSFSSDQKKKIEKDAVSKGIFKEADEKSKKAVKEIFSLDELLKEYSINVKVSSEL